MARKALISGAGIAGPALAFWLAESGWEVTVVERADRLRTSGYPVDIRGTAAEVVDRMGLSATVRAEQYRHVPVTVLSPAGRPLTRLDFGDVVNDASAGDIEITRGALTRILYEAGAGKVDYVFGDTVTGLTQRDTGVEVTFRHRPAGTFDVVVGADGIHSRIRALAFGDETRFLHHLGACVAIWDQSSVPFPPGSAVLYSHPGRTAVVERPADADVARVFMPFAHPSPGSVDRHDRAAITTELRRAFAGDRWRTAEFIDTLTDAEDVYFDTVSQVRMDRWSTGRVVLVGDAAYAPAFLSGQGTSLAITGAYVLAGELVRYDDPHAAFDAYERRLRGYVASNQRLSLRADSLVLARTRVRLWRRNLALRSRPWLRRFGLDPVRDAELRAAAVDLELAAHDLRLISSPTTLCGKPTHPAM